jgi:CDP-glucose 4,6-dehydratase
MTEAFRGFYAGKSVLVTGHTGFKGSWLCHWLRQLGASVVGYSLDPPSSPSHFEVCGTGKRITRHIEADVRDYERLADAVHQCRPDMVFHLAAQALVRPAYRDPRGTYETNVMGTVNVLEAARRTESTLGVVLVTSDKCYLNVGWEWSYRESDRLGGYEAYGTSKACAELIAASYQDAAFQQHVEPPSHLPVATGRAGNAIGGGDWATDRIIADIIRSVTSGERLLIRYPGSRRPWQHVLEALSGYLWLGQQLVECPTRNSTAWNFGPREESMHTVEQIVRFVLEHWPAPDLPVEFAPVQTEAEKLILGVDCSRARHCLGWQATWSIQEAMLATIDWYRRCYAGGDMHAFTLSQIDTYTRDAQARGARWAVA